MRANDRTAPPALYCLANRDLPNRQQGFPLSSRGNIERDVTDLPALAGW
jgi:hypothetical protein